MGSSLRLVESAPAWLKPANAMEVIVASAPPARATVASPRLMRSAAAPMESEPEQQDDVTEYAGPRAPIAMDTFAAPISVTIIGIRNGLTRPGPRVASVSTAFWTVPMPP